jgi:hypothetical protein
MSLPTTVANEEQTAIAHSSAAKDSQSFPSENSSPIRSENVHGPGPTPQNDSQSNSEGSRPRDESNVSTLTGRLRSASKRFEESSLPKGMWDATATIASSIPSLGQVRRGSFGSEGWSAEGQIEERERRSSTSRRRSSQTGEESSLRPTLSGPRSPVGARSPGSGPHHDRLPEVLDDEKENPKKDQIPSISASHGKNSLADRPAKPESIRGLDLSPLGSTSISNPQYRTSPFDNGYHFPPKHTWTESAMIFLKAFWNYTTTWLGFLVVIYGLNVVAWGGMIFLLLCNAAPAMCTPDCNDINSPRRIWIEYDAQILTALFCVTGFGLIPWRFRDLFYLLKYRLNKDHHALRRLAGIHRDWFRLEGSQNLPVLLGPENIESEHCNIPEDSVPYPLKSISNAPLTGVRASPTPVWKLDYVIWMFVWNTFLQAVLSGIMWGLNRYNRPSWATGLFVALACIVAACGGIMIFMEGKKVKGVEGIPVSEKDQERLKRDNELGIEHINNINDAAPKEKKSKTKAAGKSRKTNEILGRKENTSA